jgi:phospholipase C
VVVRDRCEETGKESRAAALPALRAASLVALVATSLTAATAQALPINGIHNIQHVVMIMQENRSFDTYFGTYPGANGIPRNVCLPDPASKGCVRPFHHSADSNLGGPHGSAAFFSDVDHGRMDGFIATNQLGRGCTSTNPECSPCSSQPEATKCEDVMGYHDAREIPGCSNAAACRAPA